MNMMTLNAESISKSVGEPVEELHVLIAKNDIAGLAAEQIAELFGVSKEEIDEIQALAIYRDIRLLLGAEHAKSLVETDFSWDALESIALKNLMQRAPMERDIETNLRIAALANKAQRRLAPQQNKILDPSQGAARVPLQLTSRIVKKLNNQTGEMSIEETKQISISDGTAKNPTFEDIDKILGVSVRPKIPSKMAIHTHEPDFSIEDIKPFKED